MSKDVMDGIRTPETRVAYLKGLLDAAQGDVTHLRDELKRAVLRLRAGRRLLRLAKLGARRASKENQP